ncbi:MAG: hypothetical protein NTV22_11335 [bacterium]|nr:hypothetical protein [bacterium]
MNSLMRLMFPWMLCFADGGGAASGSQDGGASGAAKTPSEPAAGDKSGDAETIMVSKKDYERLTGRIGQLEDGERRRTDEKKKADDEEAKKRGEHEKLLQERDAELAAVKPYQERYTTRFGHAPREVEALSGPLYDPRQNRP